MIGILVLTITAVILGIILVLVNDEDEILKHLPGLNCGACGFGSCKGMAEAIKKDKMNYLKCKPLRGKKKEELEEILGISKT